MVCYLSGRRTWAAGTVIKLDQVDTDDPTGQTKHPYLVKIDPPNVRIICVPLDHSDVIQAEVCFGPDALLMSLFSKPQRLPRERRFGLGGRVACVVEAVGGACRAWEAGTVVEVDYDTEPNVKKLRGNYDAGPRDWSWGWPTADAAVPYRVLLDGGGKVLVHRDVHWLVRDLRLQPVGPCEPMGGSHRSLARFTRRRGGDRRLWCPQQNHFFSRQFQARALATLCAAYRLRAEPPRESSASLGDLPSEIVISIIAMSAGREQIDHTTRQIRVESGVSGFDDSDDE